MSATKTIALRWYNTARGTIGYVALTGEDPGGRWFKVYVDVVHTVTDEETDARRIADRGSPLMDEALARVLAPQCADREYRY